MWSRRRFVFTLLSSSAFWLSYENNSALAFPQIKGSTRVNPHLIADEYWPPAISCNFLDVFDDNCCCMADDLGRLATAEIVSATRHSDVYPILGEINNLGNKVLFLKTIEPQLVLVIAQKQVDKNTVKDKRHKAAANADRKRDSQTDNETDKQPDRRADKQTDRQTDRQAGRLADKQTDKQDVQFICFLVNTSDIRAPRIVSLAVISGYSQMNHFAVSNLKNHPVLCVAGLDSQGKNRITFYHAKGKNKLQTLSSIKLKEAPKKLVLGTETLLVVYETQQASLFDLDDISDPQFIRKVNLSDEIGATTNYEDMCAWSSQQDGKCSLNVSRLRKFPETVSKVEAKGLLTIDALAMNDKYILALGTDEEKVSVLPFSIDKNYALKHQAPFKLEDFVENSTVPSKIVLGKDIAFISSGWAGMQFLSINQKGRWSAANCYSQQRLPVAAVVSWSNYLLLAGKELQLYDLSQNKRPKLISTTKLENPIKTVVSAGSYVLCLDESNLTLRKIENPKNVIVKVKIAGDYLSFDKINQKGYLIQSADTKDTQDTKKKKAEPSKLVELNVYNNDMQVSKTFSVLEGAHCISADEGYVLIGNLESLAIYKPDQDNELVCNREGKGVAWREIVLSKGNIYATAIDQNVNGFFIVMSFDGQAINLISSIPLPHDGLSLAVKDDIAFTLGQNTEGNSLLTTVDISNTSKPKIINSKPVLQSASVLATNKNSVAVCGQGFQIFSI